MSYLDIYKEKKVFITGHTGFKGSWIVKILSLLGAEIHGYSLSPNTNPSLFEVLDIGNLCKKSIIADIRDRDRLIKEILEFKPDYIFHLAAQPIVRTSYEIPSETFDINAIGVSNLLESVKILNKPNTFTLVITTDKVYENIEKDYAYKEEDRLGGYDPYSASKACAEIIISSFRHSFFNPKDFDKHRNKIISLRAGNVIGGGDWAKDRLIPDIIRALSENKEIIIRNPNSTRPWQHVLEPLFGYIYSGYLLSKEEVFIDSINFGSNKGDNLRVEDMVKMAIEVWGEGNYINQKLINQPHEANLLKLNIDKANQLGWTPKWDASKALKKSIEWYKEYYNNSNLEYIRNLTNNQINEYLLEHIKK